MLFPVADGHCDYLYGQINSGYDLRRPVSGQAIRLKDMKEGNVKLQFFAVWIDMKLKLPPLHQALGMIDAYHKNLELYPDDLCVLTPDYSPDSGRIATVLAIEGGEAIDGSLRILHDMYRLGVRAMTLTWNYNNELAGAALAFGNKGLTPLGKDVVLEMNRLGIAPDVSHLSDRGIDDMLSLSDAPVFASHSNARSVFASNRSLSDEHIREISRRGGTVGVNFYSKQLSKKSVPCLDDIIDHMIHIAEVGGINCCAIGSDFDGMPVYPSGLDTSKGFPDLSQRMLERGFTEQEISRIFYHNLHDYIVRYV
ncbi:MAG: dipeptidase [Clostridia bacterium]|nr:dipeptidase [Clostridia bacterium]